MSFPGGPTTDPATPSNTDTLPLSPTLSSTQSASSSTKPSITASHDLENTRGVTENSFDEFIKGMIEAYMAFGLDDLTIDKLNRFASAETKKITPEILGKIYENIRGEHDGFLQASGRTPAVVTEASGTRAAAAASMRTSAAATTGRGTRIEMSEMRGTTPAAAVSGTRAAEAAASRRISTVVDGSSEHIGGGKRSSIKRKHRSIPTIL